jgi:hypothetical protein
MLGCGESQKEAIRPDFNRSIMIDLQGATISSDTGFILLREWRTIKNIILYDRKKFSLPFLLFPA